MGYDNLSLVIDSTSRYSDAWKPYFGELNKYFPKEIKKYLITDIMPFDVETENLIEINYSNDDSYRNQFLNALKQVEEEYMIYNSEDYILYNKVDMDEIWKLVELLENDGLYDFIKLLKGPELTRPYKTEYPNVHVIDNSYNFFAQQVTLWRTQSMIDIFENSNPENGRMQQEPMGSEVCRRIGINGLQYFSGKEIKRGSQHWDSAIFPIIATAIVKGEWNTGEYGDKLEPLFETYDINPKERGTNS